MRNLCIRLHRKTLHRTGQTENLHRQIQEKEKRLEELAQREHKLQEMDRCFNNFATGLKTITPGLTDEEAVYCCLFRLNIRPTDIATLMATSRSNVSKKRARIENKLSRLSPSIR